MYIDTKALTTLAGVKKVAYDLVFSKRSRTGQYSAKHVQTNVERAYDKTHKNNRKENLKDALVIACDALDMIASLKRESSSLGTPSNLFYIENKHTDDWLHILWKTVFTAENELKGIRYNDEEGYATYPEDIFTEARRRRIYKGKSLRYYLPDLSMDTFAA